MRVTRDLFECLPATVPPTLLRCLCGFVVSTQSLAAAFVALYDHRVHAHAGVEVLQ